MLLESYSHYDHLHVKFFDLTEFNNGALRRSHARLLQRRNISCAQKIPDLWAP